MTVETDLVARGFFPREVQPPFASASLAKYCASAGIPSALQLLGNKWWTNPVRHNLARPGGLRRQLSVPNPAGHMRVSNALAGGWKSDIAPLLATATIGASTPSRSPVGRAVVASVRGHELEERRAASRQGARYLLHGDVLNFYPSIYTHSIDWAIHGKAVAKTALKSNKSTVGKLLDSAFSGAQDGQTVGIAIGPDTSLIVAECIMLRVEEALRAALPRLTEYRFWDDFELTFASLRDVDDGLAALQEAVSSYELILNPRKTRIVELPEPQAHAGIFELGDWDLTSGKRQRGQLLAYFDQVYRRLSEDRGATIAAFAVARLRSAEILANNWPLLQHNLLQLVVVEPTCARNVSEIIARQAAGGAKIDIGGIARATEPLVTKHARLGHGSEIAWAV